MKCSNCGEEIEDGSAFCNHCGAKQESITANVEDKKVEENNPEVKESENVEKTNTDIKNDENTEKTKDEGEDNEVTGEESLVEDKDKEKVTVEEEKPNFKFKFKINKKIIVLCVVILVLIVAFNIAIKVIKANTTTEKIYRKIITSMNNISEDKNSDGNTDTTSTFNITTDISSLANSLNGLSIKSSYQRDYTQNKYSAEVDISKGEDKYLNLKSYTDFQNKKIYFSDPNYYDKSVYVDLTDEYVEQIEEVLSQDNIFVDSQSKKNAISQISSVVNQNISNTMFTTIVSEDKTTDNILTMNAKEMKAFVTNVSTTLANDQNFLGYFRNKEIAENVLKYIEEYANEMNENGEQKLEIHLYTSGLFCKFAGAQIIYTKKPNDSYVCEVDVNNKTYDITFKNVYYSNETQYLNVALTINKLSNDNKDINVKFNLSQDNAKGSISIGYISSVTHDIVLNDPNASNTINVKDITEEDLESILQKLTTSPLYEALYNLGDITGIDNLFNNNAKNITLNDGQSYIVSGGDDIVKFYVPSTFNETYNGNTYKSYERKIENQNKEIEVTVNAVKMSEKDYSSSIEKDNNYYKDATDYQDYEISDVGEISVDFVTFKTRSVKYKYVSGSYSYDYDYKYYYTSINDDYTFVVKVDNGTNAITSDELNKFLTVDIEKNM